jgi:hypothetical protein
MKALLFRLAGLYRRLSLFLIRASGRTPEEHHVARIVSRRAWDEFCDALESAGAARIVDDEGHCQLTLACPSQLGTIERLTKSDFTGVRKGRVRKRGSWLRSNRAVINQHGSTMRLRFGQLKELLDARILHQVDLQGYMRRMHVPRGTRIMDNLQANGSTTLISRRLSRSEMSYGPVIVLQGEGRSTVLGITPL